MLQFTHYAILILVAAALAPLAVRRHPGAAAYVGTLGTGMAAALGLFAAINTILSQSIETQRRLWNAPYASLSTGIDPLTAFFLIPIFLVGALVALHAFQRRAGDYAANYPGEHYLFLNLTLAGAAGVAVARNAVLFLLAWELMTVASFLLVENSQRQPGGKSGGWIYLTAGHLGCAALFAMFALMGTGRILDFNHLTATGPLMSVVFILGCVGFGGKIGLAPLQTWYPEPYSQAPAHVGAILSGVVGNMGIYGLVRLLFILGKGEAPPVWWGFLLLAGGLASAIIGAARSMGSRDLSRLLAWSSVENYGLIASGIGLGLVAAESGNGIASFLGFAAAILHTLNHSVAKSLLFLTAATIYPRTGTRNLDRMGGLMHRLPATGALFLVGALGAACVPPLNGFAGEFLLLMSAFKGALGSGHAPVSAGAMMLAIALVAVTSGLAVAAYLKAFGFAFLGNPKGPGAVSRSKERRSVLLPHMALAAAAVLMAAFSPRILDFIGPTAGRLAGLWRESATGNHDIDLWLASRGDGILDSAFVGSWLVAGCVALAYIVRRTLTRGKAQETAPTWDCGYAAPDARMQYTASSFTRPLADDFQVVVNLDKRETPPRGLFPTERSESLSEAPGVERAWGFGHLFRAVNRVAGSLRVFQSGRVQTYLLYMGLALVILLIWKL